MHIYELQLVITGLVLTDAGKCFIGNIIFTFSPCLPISMLCLHIFLLK